jgi:hypothetical protein
MFVTAASSDCVLASKKPKNSMSLEWDARSGEMSQSAKFADWTLAEGADKFNAARIRG